MLQQSGHRIQNQVLKSYREATQKRTATFVVSDYDYSSSISSILNQLNWPSLAIIRRQVSRLAMFYQDSW